MKRVSITYYFLRLQKYKTPTLVEDFYIRKRFTYRTDVQL